MVSVAIWVEKCNWYVLTNHGRNLCRMDVKIPKDICGLLEHPQNKMGRTFLANPNGAATFERSEFEA